MGGCCGTQEVMGESFLGVQLVCASHSVIENTTRAENGDMTCYFSGCRIIQQLVNGIIAPTAMPNIGMGPW